ncbi:MAG: DMT family transporter [Porticoccaceae bacterium]|jgi:drug/metabolite transporter (DMT)-like permease|nr:DMT family transporter [Porticoccaceae bacterium]MBT6421608.1 DMT family transporter [Porticoccaceae bacterium]
MNRRSAIFALLTAGLAWGTTGIYVRVLGLRGFSSFELLGLRLLVVFMILIPILLLLHLRQSAQVLPLTMTQRKTALTISFLMLFYYLGAIVAIQHLPLVMAVLLFGSSPLIAWALNLILEKRLPVGKELTQSLGVLLGMTGLVGLALSQHPGSGAPENAIPIIGYLGGITAAVVTVVNAQILRRSGEQAPSSLSISILTALLGTLLAPLLFIDSVDLFAKIHESWGALLGFGALATLIPGFAIAHAGSRLPATATSTVTIQLQVWTIILGWIILNETLSGVQVAAALVVMLGTGFCLVYPEPHDTEPL